MTAQAALAGEPLERTIFAVPGAHCAGCMAKIEGGLGKLPNVVSARLNLTSRQLSVSHSSSLQVPELVAAIDRLGFAAQPLTAQDAVSSDAQMGPRPGRPPPRPS